MMSVTLSLGSSATKLAVPSSAILRDGLYSFTFVQKLDGYVERRKLTLGQSDGEFVEVIHGVDAGELVVSTGGRELQTAFASLR